MSRAEDTRQTSNTPGEGDKKVLIVLGAGPKGLAISVKRHALEEAGFTVPDIVVIDRTGIGANWGGQWGYTHGRSPLGTAPEKDLGFPYSSRADYWSLPSEIDPGLIPNDSKDMGEVWRYLLANYSYHAYLISRNRHGDYVDASKPHPYHRDWCDYLKWAGDRVFKGPSSRFIQGEISSIGIEKGRWAISVNDEVVLGDGLAVTGPGDPRFLTSPDHKDYAQHVSHPRLLDGRTFWAKENQELLARGLKENDQVAVVGSGETAASVLISLQQIDAKIAPIVVYCSTGILHSRGEGYWENSVYTHPKIWHDLDDSTKRDFISRTDRGVLSVTAMKTLSEFRHQIYPVKRRVFGAKGLDRSIRLALQVGSRVGEREFDLVVNCTGFNPFSFLRLLPEEAKAVIERQANSTEVTVGGESVPISFTKPETVYRAIEYDLAIRGVVPRLHLPMVSGFAQGPGFPNLSCLGTLSDRILSSYSCKR